MDGFILNSPYFYYYKSIITTRALCETDIASIVSVPLKTSECSLINKRKDRCLSEFKHISEFKQSLNISRLLLIFSTNH